MSARPRPVSPHLEIYRFTITMAMSIVHRVTGAALYLGTLLLVGWLLAAAIGPDALRAVEDVFGSFIGQVVLFGYTWALFHHMLGGLRYFVWDSIHGHEAGQREALAWANAIASVILSVIAWALFVWGAGQA